MLRTKADRNKKPKSAKSNDDSIMAKIMAAAAAKSVIITPKDELKPEDLAVIPARDDDNLIRLSQVYTRMGISAEEVEFYPKVTPDLETVGGPVGAVEYLRSSSDLAAKELVRVWDTYQVREQTQAIIPFEAYCLAAKLTKKKFLQLLMGEVCEQSDVVSTLLAASSHPDIVKTTIRVAKGDGFGASEARATLHKHRGFLPTPKTQQVTIHGNVNQDNRQDNSKNILIPIGDLDLGTEKIGRATDRFNEARIIRSESTDANDADVIDAEHI